MGEVQVGFQGKGGRRRVTKRWLNERGGDEAGEERKSMGRIREEPLDSIQGGRKGRRKVITM